MEGWRDGGWRDGGRRDGGMDVGMDGGMDGWREEGYLSCASLYIDTPTDTIQNIDIGNFSNTVVIPLVKTLWHIGIGV